MRSPASVQLPRAAIGICLLLVALATPVRGIVKFNEGHDEIFITGTAGLAYDSNIFAVAGGASDTSFNGTLDLDYVRKAGLIGVNGNLGLSYSDFFKNTSESFVDPHARAEFTKGTGRTTGSLELGVAKQSRSDSVLNLRTTSWDYDAGFNAKYPVIDRYSLSGHAGYDYQDYLGGQGLFDIRTYTASSDLYYVYTSERDLLGGYRLRVTDTSAGTRSYDHAFTVGTTGKLLPKLNGTVRLGYQFRETDRGSIGGVDDKYSAFTASLASTWTISSRINVTAQASRDFSTLATDTNVDTTSGRLDAQFATTAKITLFAGTGVGRIRFLGAGQANRHDTYLTFDAGVNYTLNEHFKITLSGMEYTNWSTYDRADYKRHTISLIVSSRW
jgi:hypothetical protein